MRQVAAYWRTNPTPHQPGSAPTGPALRGVGVAAKDAVGRTTVIADGGYRGTGLVIPHRRERGPAELPAWKEERNTSHRKVRARVEHAFARMKTSMLSIIYGTALGQDRVLARAAAASAAIVSGPRIPLLSSGRGAFDR